MMKYFDRHFTVVGVASGMSALIPGSATYTQVTFESDDPHRAEAILNTILLAPDQIVREDQRRDVVARISALKNELAQVTVSDERSSLIEVLTAQEQVLTMIQADHRYASNLVVPPFASPWPKSPTPLGCIIVAILVTLIVWIGLVFLSSRVRWIGSLTGWFRKRPKQQVRATG
jgi:hypothetical protein